MALANPNRVRSVNRRTVPYVPSSDRVLAFDADRIAENPGTTVNREDGVTWVYMDDVDEETPSSSVVIDWDRWDPIKQHTGVVMTVDEFAGRAPESPFWQVEGWKMSWSELALDLLTK